MNRKKKITTLILSVTTISFFLFSKALYADAANKQTTPATPHTSKQLKKALLSPDTPLYVTSDQARYNNKIKESIYEGNVVVTKGPARLAADRITGKGGETDNQFESLVAKGDTVFAIEDKQGCADTLLYFTGTIEQAVAQKTVNWKVLDRDQKLTLINREATENNPLPATAFERLILEGNPKIHQGSSLITGDAMCYFRLAERLEVMGNVFVHYNQIATAPQKETKRKAKKKTETGIKKQPSPQKTAPVYIFADQAVFRQHDHQLHFYGKIKMYREDMVVQGERMTVYFDNQLKTIIRIVAEEQVNISWEDRVLTAGKCVFYEKKQQVVLTDNPVATQGRNRLTGERMVYDLTKDTLVVKKALSSLYPHDFQQEKPTKVPAEKEEKE